MKSGTWMKWPLLACLALGAGACADTLTDISSVDFVDHDGDGYDDSGADCDPEQATINVQVDSWQDNDGDGYGKADTLTKACPGAVGYVTNGADCNDVDRTIHPGAAEVCDGIDQSCNERIDDDATDALIFFADVDGDGYGDRDVSTRACSAPVGYVTDGTDCDDADKAAHPGLMELCNGKDDDCDEVVDEADAVDTGTWYADGDGDGHGDVETSSPGCTAPAGTVSSSDDCDDEQATIYPGAVEVCDGIDQSCNDQVDEGVKLTFYRDADADGYGISGDTAEECSAPVGYVAVTGDCDDGDGKAHPGASEICDGKDDDCNGSVSGDEADVDKDGYRGCSGDCNDTNASIHPGVKETCNNADDDCNGYFDEGFEHYNYYADVDGDGFGSEDAVVWNSCVAPKSGYTGRRGDCNDGDKSIHPGATDKSNDAIDSDCGGSVEKDPSVGLEATGYTKIQDAINAAANNATVWVGPGTYHEANIQFGAKDIKLRSTDFAESTIVDGAGFGTSIFVLDSSSFSGYDHRYVDSSIDGLLIRDASTGGGSGGGIYLSSADLVISNCIVQNNETLVSGGGLYIDSASPSILNSRIIGNQADVGEGGGVYVIGSAAKVVLTGCRIESNSAKLGSATYSYGAQVEISNSILANNFTTNPGVGGTVQLKSAVLAASNCLILSSGSQITNAYVDALSKLDVKNSVIESNAGYNLYFAPGGNDKQGSATITYSDIYSASGQNFYPTSPANVTLGAGVLMVAPQFVSATDYHLALGSPLVNAGDPTLLDPDGSRADIGIYGGPDGGQRDLDGDLYPDYFWPGGICDRPKGATSAAYSFAFDANDQDASIHSRACP